MSLSEVSETLRFQPLSETVHFHRPEGITAFDPEAPRIILVFGFNDAPMRTLLKNFVNNYAKKWPSASIIVVLSRSSWLIRSQKDKECLLMPAIKILVEEVYETTGDSPNGLLIHMLSNGGGVLFADLMGFLERALSYRQGATLPPGLSIKQGTIPLAIVFDSVPSGVLDGERLVSPIKSPVARAIALVPANLACHALFASYFLLGIPHPLRAMQARLLREDIVPGLSEYSTPRLYHYSEGDVLVNYKEIEEHLHHLREAIGANRAAGQWPIFVEKYEPSSMHVKHVKTDPVRYWAAIDRLWKAALRKPLEKAKL